MHLISHTFFRNVKWIKRITVHCNIFSNTLEYTFANMEIPDKFQSLSYRASEYSAQPRHDTLILRLNSSLSSIQMCFSSMTTSLLLSEQKQQNIRARKQERNRFEALLCSRGDLMSSLIPLQLLGAKGVTMGHRLPRQFESFPMASHFKSEEQSQMNGCLDPCRFPSPSGNAFSIGKLPRKNTTKSKWRQKQKRNGKRNGCILLGAQTHGEIRLQNMANAIVKLIAGQRKPRPF